MQDVLWHFASEEEIQSVVQQIQYEIEAALNVEDGHTPPTLYDPSAAEDFEWEEGVEPRQDWMPRML